MYDGSDVRSLLIHSHMHLDLGGRTEAGICLDHVSVLVHLADVVRGHEALGHTGRRAEKLMIVQLDGNVAVIGCNHVAVVDSLADVTNLFLDFILVYHFCSSLQCDQ